MEERRWLRILPGRRRSVDWISPVTNLPVLAVCSRN
jgi:hypothetical protein